MADPFTGTIAVGILGVGATLVSAAVTGGVGAVTLAYNVHKDRKSAKLGGQNNTMNMAPANSTYNPYLVYQPSASYQKSGTEIVSFGPDGRFSAVGRSASDWSCGTITYYAPGGFPGRNNGPAPPYYQR